MKRQNLSERKTRNVRREPFGWLWRKRCHYCGSTQIYLCHYPRRHQYVCEPCYLLQTKPPQVIELIIQCFDSPYRPPRYRFCSGLRECIGWLLRLAGIGTLRKLRLL